MSSATQQRDIFIGGEGDAYFRRNARAYATQQAGHVALPLAVIRSYLQPGARVLEIGCANGVNLETLRREAGCECSGIDPSAQAIEAGRRDFPALDLHRATADALPFADGAFDLVWFGFCLYVTDRALLPRVVAEADRVLKDGGALAVVDFDPDAPVRRRYAHAPGSPPTRPITRGCSSAFPNTCWWKSARSRTGASASTPIPASAWPSRCSTSN